MEYCDSYPRFFILYMTPLLALPTSLQWTHHHFHGGTLVNLNQLGGELLSHGWAI